MRNFILGVMLTGIFFMCVQPCNNNSRYKSVKGGVWILDGRTGKIVHWEEFIYEDGKPVKEVL